MWPFEGCCCGQCCSVDDVVDVDVVSDVVDSD